MRSMCLIEAREAVRRKKKDGDVISWITHERTGGKVTMFMLVYVDVR